MPGNDDAGALSAWFVFSAMGFYPVTPGAPEYRLGSPLFDRVTIRLSRAHHRGESFTIEAMRSSPSDILVDSASLDGDLLDDPALPHEAITSGGVLRFEMTSGTN